MSLKSIGDIDVLKYISAYTWSKCEYIYICRENESNGKRKIEAVEKLSLFCIVNPYIFDKGVFVQGYLMSQSTK